MKIGKVYSEGGDYKKAAKEEIQNLYGYDLSSVLFKPTLASAKQFRGTFDGALSYFVGGNETYPENKGFAIAPYTKVRWENSGIIDQHTELLKDELVGYVLKKLTVRALSSTQTG